MFVSVMIIWKAIAFRKDGIDTNERNLAARAMYSKYGYQEIDIVPTTFNGIEGVNLVLLEKQIQSGEKHFTA